MEESLESTAVRLRVGKGKGRWAEQPIAFTQNRGGPRGVVGGMLFALAERGSERVNWTKMHAVLKPGKYLVNAYIDRQGRLEQDPAGMLST